MRHRYRRHRRRYDLCAQGEHELGRNESRLGELLDSRDYCKLHIVEHYIARLMGSGRDASFLSGMAGRRCR